MRKTVNVGHVTRVIQGDSLIAILHSFPLLRVRGCLHQVATLLHVMVTLQLTKKNPAFLTPRRRPYLQNTPLRLQLRATLPQFTATCHLLNARSSSTTNNSSPIQGCSPTQYSADMKPHSSQAISHQNSGKVLVLAQVATNIP